MDREEESPGSGFLNLDTLYDVHKKKDINKIEVYRRIYQRCQDKVKKTNDRLGKMECLYEVPTFLLGTPIYDYDDLKSYIIFRLRENGITHCYFVDQNNLFISWRPEHIDKKRYQAAKKKYGLEPSIYEKPRHLPEYGSGGHNNGGPKKSKGGPQEPNHSGMLKFSSEIGVPVNMDKIRMVEGPRLGGQSHLSEGLSRLRRGQISADQEDFKPEGSAFAKENREGMDRRERFEHQSQERVARQERLDRQSMERKPPSRHMLNSWHNYFSRIRNGNKAPATNNTNNTSNWANPYL